MDPLIEVAVEPKSLDQRAQLTAALVAIAAQDADLRVSIDRESGQTLLGGMGERHLELAFDRLIREFGVGVQIGAPQVAYREALMRPVEIDYTHKKQLGGAGEFARVKILFEPLPAGAGYRFETDLTDNAIPLELIRGIAKGLDASRQNGVVAGFPLVDFQVTLTDGAYHEVDSTPLTFEIAARAALRQLKDRKAIALLEPIMKLEVTAPDEFLGAVIGDINARRGQLKNTRTEAGLQVVTAAVPLSELFGYENALGQMTRARPHFTLTFSHYERVPVGPSDDDPPRFPPAIGMRA